MDIEKAFRMEANAGLNGARFMKSCVIIPPLPTLRLWHGNDVPPLREEQYLAWDGQ
jgi:hypothetical protein